MLKTLSIKNIAVIENVSIDFMPGFNILTGETGAGKSIIIDSLNLIKGERAQKDIIRAGEEKARVDAIFDLSDTLSKKLSDILGIDIDGELLVSREIYKDGKGNIKINGMPLTLSMLKEAGEHLLTIHGQHDNTSLLSKKNHIGILDSYDKEIAKAKEEYLIYHKEYKKTLNEIESLETDEKELARRKELICFQIDEIESANLVIGEDEELLKKKAVIENSYKIAESSAKAYALLYDGAMGQSAYDMVSVALKAMESVTGFDSQIEDAYSSLSDAMDIIKENSRFLKNYSDNLEFATGELDSIDDRLDDINTLKAKYGSKIEKIFEKRDALQEELQYINTSDERKEELNKLLTSLSIKREKCADALTLLRKKSASKLSAEVMKSLADLCMPNVTFDTLFAECDYKTDGKDDVEFLVCTNAGEEAKPLAKIASGGELSRIMLAIKGALSGCSGEELLIFDEIDTGVSGLAAQKIGEKLRETSKYSQVICITHLPQIAAMADSHYLIEKKADDSRTKTSVTLMDNDMRIREIARTLGGASITDAAIQNAKELIELAKKEKR